MFMMGKFEARDTDRSSVTSNRTSGYNPTGEALRVGFTSYAVRLLQDVYFLDWQIDPDTTGSQEAGDWRRSKARKPFPRSTLPPMDACGPVQ